MLVNQPNQFQVCKEAFDYQLRALDRDNVRLIVEDGVVMGRRLEDSPTDGEGYGAGSGNGWAAKGVVILEIVK